MQYLGYETLITILLPGSILFWELYIVLERYASASRITLFLRTLPSTEGTFLIVILLASALLGTFLASCLSWLEPRGLDRISTRRLQLSRAQFEMEWLLYIDSLDTRHNPWIDRMVLYFFFETRCAVAGLLLGLFLALSHYSWIGVLVVELASLVLLRLGIEAHRELADFRHRRYGSLGLNRIPLWPWPGPRI